MYQTARQKHGTQLLNYHVIKIQHNSITHLSLPFKLRGLKKLRHSRSSPERNIKYYSLFVLHFALCLRVIYDIQLVFIHFEKSLQSVYTVPDQC